MHLLWPIIESSILLSRPQVPLKKRTSSNIFLNLARSSIVLWKCSRLNFVRLSSSTSMPKARRRWSAAWTTIWRIAICSSCAATATISRPLLRRPRLKGTTTTSVAMAKTKRNRVGMLRMEEVRGSLAAGAASANVPSMSCVAVAPVKSDIRCSSEPNLWHLVFF